MPALGAPLTYVTTTAFLSVFGLGSLRDLPDIEALEEAGLLQRGPPIEANPNDLDQALGLTTEEEAGSRLTGAMPEGRVAPDGRHAG